MYLQKIQLRNFRCFDSFQEELSSKIILIEGKNGSGKTTLLEALYYLCYLRSFKTRITKDLIGYHKDNFFLKINLSDDVSDKEIQAGFSKDKRSIKIDNQNAKSYKDLLSQYKIVALTEDDLNLIKGSPEKRRMFLDHYALLVDPELIKLLKYYKNIVENRNAILKKNQIDIDSYEVYTNQLWQYSQKIRENRISVLKELESEVTTLFKNNFNKDISIKFEYKIKHGSIREKNFLELKSKYPHLINQEIRFRKPVLGAHFDDFDILWDANSVKNFSSRGQQKLLVVLLKIAQMKKVISKNCCSIFLLDDFLTDFDEEKLQKLIPIITNLNCQILFTCPLENSKIKEVITEYGAKIIKI